jgi:hypothetical protein
MLTRLRAHLPFVKVTATLAFALVLTVLAMQPAVTVHAAPAAGTWVMGGSQNQIPTCTNCDFSLPATGVGTIGSNLNRANDVLSPNVAITASNLSVAILNPPGAGRSITFVLGVDPAHSIRCVISNTQTSCNSGATTATIPANSFLSMAIVNGGAPPTLVKFSWLATPQ